MPCYIVAFQIRREEALKRVVAALEGFDRQCQINATCWAVVTDGKAAALRDHLKQFVESGDRIFVIRSGTAAAWMNAISKQHTEWLKENL
jgi:hypothetical protein